MVRLLVTGGRQRQPVRLEPMREWRLYDQARILELDTRSGEVAVRLEYEGPPERVPDEAPCHVFKAASAGDDELLVPTQTEVLELDPRTLAVRRTRTHPWFNDVHHAARIDGRLHVVSTGLDRLLVLDERDQVLEVRPALPEDELRALQDGVDYRKLATTKPHAAHPNYVFRTAAGTWLTRFEQRDAVCLERPELRYELGQAQPHDGVAAGGWLWFTTVDGRLVAFDPGSNERRLALDLEQLLEAREPLGWCRGLLVRGDVAYVGFSRIRYTRLRKNLSWVRRRFRSARGYTGRPTRVVAVDLARGALRGEWDLEPYGLNAIFSVLEAA